MFLIRSGIPSLDAMFRAKSVRSAEALEDREEEGISLTDSDATSNGTTTICIAGPDGTGKSALAMHFASRYMADVHEYCRTREKPHPLAFYVSSDLSYEMADLMWKKFALHKPNERRIPFRYPQIWIERRTPAWLGGQRWEKDYHLPLVRRAPDRLSEIAEVLCEPIPSQEIAFVDLASRTAGDDWGFIERLLATIPNVEHKDAPRHLLIIDAMEGMETFGGDVDAFGQRTLRRNRVAKLTRLARPKCHLLLVVEEPSEGARLAEQFIADIVLRLRATEDHGYSRRTIEIEKARGQAHVRGRHPYVIRDGRGSTTGEQVNFDDPFVEFHERPQPPRTQSYIDVFSSLHAMSRQIMEGRGPGRDKPSGFCAGFGIQELDEMLAPGEDDRELSHFHGHDARGLPCGTVTALIGDANTQKSFLSLAFLGHVFHELAWNLVTRSVEEQHAHLQAPEDFQRYIRPFHDHYLDHLCAYGGRSQNLPTRPVSPESLPYDWCRWAARIEFVGTGFAGAAVLITTKDENHRTLVRRFYDQLGGEMKERARREELPAAAVEHIQNIWDDDTAFESAFCAYLESRTICRRLEIHDTPSPVLFHVIRRSIEAAQQLIKEDYVNACMGPRLLSNVAERAREGWRIRLVMDDFDTVMRTYGRVHDDPLFLPFVLQSFRREGLSSLIVETQSATHGMPALSIGDDTQSDLRALSDHRIFTWHVQFFGDQRIAIAAIPPMARQDWKSPVLVRELEWYEPNRNLPPRVSPEFELYAGLDTGQPTLVPLQVHLYAETPAWQQYIAHLDELWKRVFDPPTPESERGRRPVVLGEKGENYDLIRELCDLHSNTSIDYSLIVQVDEFWRHRDAFQPQAEYLTRPTLVSVENNRDRDQEQQVVRKRWFSALQDAKEQDLATLDRIPFVWDFGFIAFRERLWNEATMDAPRPKEADEVRDLWEKRRDVAEVWERLRQGQSCTWAEVLEAASFVARWESARQARRVPAFDLAMVAPETFSCLVLEIWLSEIYITKKARSEPDARSFANTMGTRLWCEQTIRDIRLHELANEFWMELYATWLLLAESLDLSAFHPREEGFGFAFGRKSDPNAVAVRHWYKSAAILNVESDEAGPMRFCRLPGTFSVRGDWFLATVRGSRSNRLAGRALDLLSTAAANIDRLIRGVGLPTRALKLDGKMLSTRLWGWRSERQDPGTFSYDDVLALGAQEGPTEDFHWLWRSNLRHYYAAAPVWERWLYRVFRRWSRTREFVGSDWVGGFQLYKQLRSGRKRDLDKVKKLASYHDFQRIRDVLIKELKQVDAEIERKERTPEVL